MLNARNNKELSCVDERHKCSIIFNNLQTIGEVINHNFSRIVIIIDEKVYSLWKKKIDLAFKSDHFVVVDVIETPQGESSKNLKEYIKIINKFQSLNLCRRDLIVVIGGGAICDLGGFVASSFMRGLPYLLIPTSLIAIVDASVGGKVALNLPSGKNLLGSFYMPDNVLIDIRFLESIPDSEFYQGFGEIIKIATICNDMSFFELLETISCKRDDLLFRSESFTGLIKSTIKKKLDFVEIDWQERNLNRLLNAGHAIAHGLEKLFDFDRSLIMHGEAVALGLASCARFSHDKGLINYSDMKRIINLLIKFHLPVSLELKDDNKERLRNAIQMMKRVRHDDLRLVLPEQPHKSFIYHGEDAINVINFIHEDCELI